MKTAEEIRRELRDSLDMAVIGRDLLLTIIIVAICLCCFALGAGGFRDESFRFAAAFISAITIIPVLIYSLWISLKIFRRPERYLFSRCKLSQPHQCKWGRGAMYFTVVFEDPEDGGKYILNTRPIFASYGIIGPLLEEYINKTVTIAYNEETETVVVIS